jgi:hypothetical protein
LAHTNRVIQSINAQDGHLCVDIFERPDHSYGFEEYRRDAEDLTGWFPIGHHGTQRFESAEAALDAAKAAVGWLD